MYYLVSNDGELILLGDRRDVIKYYRFAAVVLEGSYICSATMKDCSTFFHRHFDYQLVKLKNLPPVVLDDDKDEDLPFPDTSSHHFEKWG